MSRRIVSFPGGPLRGHGVRRARSGVTSATLGRSSSRGESRAVIAGRSTGGSAAPAWVSRSEFDLDLYMPIAEWALRSPPSASAPGEGRSKALTHSRFRRRHSGL